MEMITASELAEWVYSREEWRKRRLGLSKPDFELIEAGNRLHARKEASQRRGGLFLSIGIPLTLIALLWLLFS